MSENHRRELTGLGPFLIAPFAIGAAAVWAPSRLVSPSLVYDLTEIVILYGAVVAAWRAGAGAGGILASGSREPLLPGIIAALVAWTAAWPPGVLPIKDVMRVFLLIGVFAYLALRDLRGAREGQAPGWYVQLGRRAALWAGGFLLVMAFGLVL